MAKDYLYMLELIEKFRKLYGRQPTQEVLLSTMASKSWGRYSVGLYAMGMHRPQSFLPKRRTEAMETFYIFLISYSLQGHPIERTILLKTQNNAR